MECTTANADGSYNVPEDWALKPSGLAVGTKFRLLFVTSTRRDATATDIATYNTFVQTRAKAGHSAISDSCGNRFTAVASTATVDARTNISLPNAASGGPVYWLGGPKIADHGQDFWDGSWDNEAAADWRSASGSVITLSTGADREIWTGTSGGGVKGATGHLGTTTDSNLRALVGQPGAAGAGPVDGARFSAIQGGRGHRHHAGLLVHAHRRGRDQDLHRHHPLKLDRYAGGHG